jgi:hypothetical protein
MTADAGENGQRSQPKRQRMIRCKTTFKRH